MVTNARIQDLIRENRPDEITDAIAAGEYFQMQTFAQSLIELVLSGVVDREVAANAATNRHDFLVALEQAEKHQAALEREAAADAPRPETGEEPKSSFTSPRIAAAPEPQPSLRSVGAATR